MDYFNYQGAHLYAEEVAVNGIASQYGTPCFIYSRAALERNYHAYAEALAKYPHLVCFAVKANSNIAVLNILARLGAGFDVVSGGELDRVLAAGGDAKKIIFSGLGKSTKEIQHALDVGIYCFNVESEAELSRINEVAQIQGVIAPISLRVNPDVDARTHPYISTGLKENKFGIPASTAVKTYKKAATMPGIGIMGIDFHIGSQLTSVEPFLEAIKLVLEIVDELAIEGIKIRHFDIGGGLGVTYGEERPPHPSEFVEKILQNFSNRDLIVLVEPGRSIAANAGIFLTRVEYLKCNDHKNFAIVDGAMNDLIRPALYGAWQDIIPVQKTNMPTAIYDVVGPVCESSDFLGKERALSLQAGDLLAVRSAGAYCFVMSSNYNSRPKSAEIMVDGSEAFLVRERESITELFASENMLPD